MAAITDQMVLERRREYACCQGNFVWLIEYYRSTGELECIPELEDKVWLIDMALSVLCQYAVGDEDGGQMCIDDDLLRCIMKLVDPICVKCGCGTFTPPPPPPSPPATLFSFLVRAENVGTTASVYPAPNQTTVPFNFVTEDAWTLSFDMRLTNTLVPPNNRIITLMTPLVYDIPPAGEGADMFIRMNDNGPGSFYMSLEFGVDVDPSNQAAVVMFPFPTAAVDEWHSFTLKRNGTFGLDASWQWYMDGLPIGTFVFAVGTPWASFSFPAQAPIVGSNTLYATPGPGQSSGSLVAQTYYICNFYVCKTARTDAEVLNIIHPNLMAGSDNAWQRLLWLGPFPNDVTQAIGGIMNNSFQGPSYTAAVEVDLVPDVPSWI